MSAAIKDLSIFKRFDFPIKPVGVKFLLFKPEGMDRLQKNLSVCEMLKEAGTNGPFYAGVENFTCVEPILLGMAEGDAIFESGYIGETLHIFEEARANRRLYHYITKLERHSVNYVAFSPLDSLTWDPDVLVLPADADALEIILRAACYSTGKMWTSKGTPVIACSWLLTYPYISGEINYIPVEVSHGMRAKEVWPKGTILISIPYDRLSGMVEELNKIEWHPAMYKEGREAHDRKFAEAIETLHGRMEKQG